MIQVIRRALVNAAQLFTAFSFFRLRGADLAYFQIWLPSLTTIIFFSLYWLTAGTIFTIQLPLIVNSATTLMGVLIGFYIAALAAVTSFPNESLNSVMAGDAPKIKEKQSKQELPVTRRRFLSILLGYCAFMSIFIYAVGSLFSSVALVPSVYTWLPALLTALWWVFYTWITSSLLVVTMLCLHYLVDRMHRA